MGGCAFEARVSWLCLVPLGGMPVGLSGLNLLIRFLLLSKLQVYTAGDTQESM
jgi:hypothetical protein|tara:strand:- start:267 stop:425 length:159 start_codon:yes stop_codon:yes gene_type:complete